MMATTIPLVWLATFGGASASKRPTTGKPDLAGASQSQFRIGPTSAVLTADHLEEVFGVGVASCRIGKACFFVPLGRMASDAETTAGRTAAHTHPGEVT